MLYFGITFHRSFFLYGELVTISKFATLRYLVAPFLPANCGLVSFGEPMRYLTDKPTSSGSPGAESSCQPPVSLHISISGKVIIGENAEKKCASNILCYILCRYEIASSNSYEIAKTSIQFQFLSTIQLGSGIFVNKGVFSQTEPL